MLDLPTALALILAYRDTFSSVKLHMSLISDHAIQGHLHINLLCNVTRGRVGQTPEVQSYMCVCLNLSASYIYMYDENHHTLSTALRMNISSTKNISHSNFIPLAQIILLWPTEISVGQLWY